MLTLIVSGRLVKEPQTKTTRAGNVFAVAMLATGSGDEATFVNLAAFDESLVGRLLACHKGEELAVSGPCKIGTYQTAEAVRASVQLTVTRILGASELVAPPQAQKPRASRPLQKSAPQPAGPPPFDDPIPF